MRRVTVTLEDGVARWARVAAAQAEMSLSRFVSRLLRDEMEGRRRYDAAMERNLARKPVALKSRGRYPRRDEVHER
jgi:hypothetical protein